MSVIWQPPVKAQQKIEKALTFARSNFQQYTETKFAVQEAVKTITAVVDFSEIVAVQVSDLSLITSPAKKPAGKSFSAPGSAIKYTSSKLNANAGCHKDTYRKTTQRKSG